jgi:hypothetical protein
MLCHRASNRPVLLAHACGESAGSCALISVVVRHGEAPSPATKKPAYMNRVWTGSAGSPIQFLGRRRLEDDTGHSGGSETTLARSSAMGRERR